MLPAMRLAVLALACSIAGCGVETYRERPPSPDLSIRMVATDGEDAEVLPRFSGPADELLPIVRRPIVEAAHIRHVRLLDSADGTRVIVLDLDDLGRAQLEEASRAHIGGRMAIVAGGRVIAAPTIRNPLTESEAYVAVPPASLEGAFSAMTASPR
jgi:preprotein translocase subunit SecD